MASSCSRKDPSPASAAGMPRFFLVIHKISITVLY
jgi:hypothetical protein